MKPLKITEDVIKNVMIDFEKELRSSTAGTERISYSKRFMELVNAPTAIKEKIILKFTADAYMKMMCLTRDSNLEVGWHGIVDRISDTEFFVTDIIVYPQYVTGVTITPDATEYAMWLMKQPDEIFERIRFHGHSHVRMATGPSGIDDQYRSDMTANIQDDDYYIFLITNHKASHNPIIYDFKNNLSYDKTDIDVVVVTADGTNVTTWVKENEKLVKQQHVAPTNFTSYGRTYTPTSINIPDTRTEAERAEDAYLEGDYDSVYLGQGQYVPANINPRQGRPVGRPVGSTNKNKNKQQGKGKGHDTHGYDTKEGKWYIISRTGTKIYLTHKPTKKEIAIYWGEDN